MLSSTALQCPYKFSWLQNSETMCKEATSVLLQAFGNVPTNITCTNEPANQAFGTGEGINLWATTENGCLIGADALGGKS